MDDEEMIRDLAKTQFSHLGHKVVLAADGSDAINKYNEIRQAGAEIDIIIMDLTIPVRMGGQEAVQKILAINPKAKVIVSSGYSGVTHFTNIWGRHISRVRKFIRFRKHFHIC